MSTSTGNLTPNQTAALEEEQQYDPNLAVPYWHQDMELATICIANALTRTCSPRGAPRKKSN